MSAPKFQELHTSQHTFDSFFNNYLKKEYLMAGLIYYKRYSTRFPEIDQQSRMNLYCLCYFLGIKVTHDECWVTISQFLNVYDLPNTLKPIIVKYEFEFCNAIDWELYVSNTTYSELSQLISTSQDVKRLVLEV